MGHHTKDKGDLGLGFIIADLMRAGIQVALPISEHLPFDCIAISKDLKMKRISVKYRAAKNGAVALERRSSWADKNGSHVNKHERGTYDAFALYCPDTAKCYYVREDEVTKESFTIRISGARKPLHNADDFCDPARLFVLVAQPE